MRLNLPKESLLEMYWRMLLSRRLDERAWELHRHRKIAFHLSSIGHEAAQVGAAYALERGKDWVVPYYRDLTLMLALGLTPREYLLSLMARADDPASGGRQMPNLWSLKRARVISQSSSVGAQTSQAVGIALGIKMRLEERVVLTTAGEGATTAGEWYEAVNWAATQQLPVIFLVENNQYALSVHQKGQMAVDNVADRARGFGLPGRVVDGTDFLAVYRVVKEAVDRARSGGGPSILEAKTYRITPHSSDDDDRAYRRQEEVEAFRKRDPLLLARTYLETQSILAPRTNTRMESKARDIVEDAVRFAEVSEDPSAESAAYPVFHEDQNNG